MQVYPNYYGLCISYNTKNHKEVSKVHKDGHNSLLSKTT
jgi:hypothetical protein